MAGWSSDQPRPSGFSTRMPGVPASRSACAAAITARPRRRTLWSRPTASSQRRSASRGKAPSQLRSTTTRRASIGTSGVWSRPRNTLRCQLPIFVCHLGVRWAGLRAPRAARRTEREPRGDALEALARVNAGNGQQAMLMRGPRLPLGAPRGVEQRHFDHVDHVAHATCLRSPSSVLHRSSEVSEQAEEEHAVEQGGGHSRIAVGPAYCIVRFERVEALDEAGVVGLDRSLEMASASPRTATPSARWSRFRPSSCGIPEREQMRTECGRASRRKT